jgi:uncharacterized protein YndB with AHSA1/START domain
MTMTTLAERLDRAIVIRARPDIVFRYFTDSGRWARWWGAGSSIDPRPGGEMRIRYPDGTEAAGEVIEIAAPTRIVFTYGYASGAPIPPGGSRVTIRVDPHEQGARVALTHEFADAAVRDQHVQGWRYQLSLFSNVVVDEALAGAADAVDAWFAAWATVDERARRDALARIAAPTVTVRDRYSAIDGLEELHAHIGAALRFMPGVRLQRTGGVRHCQGTALADWTATGPEGRASATGTNVFVFDADGRITAVTGLWN